MSRLLGPSLTVVRRLTIGIVMILIVMRPGWGAIAVHTQQTDLDVLVVVDRTRSMDARDGPGGEPRLALVRQDLTSLAARLPGARFAAVTFGGKVVRQELPYTTDTSAFDALVETIKPEGPYDGVGSRLDAPLDLMTNVLADDSDQHPERRRVVVLVSDGENTAPGTQRSFASAGAYVDGGAVLGYGTEAGGKMLLDDARPQEGYIVDSTNGDDALSRIDTGNLQRVAAELGTSFVRRQAPDPGRIDRLAASFKATPASSKHVEQHQREITWILGLVLLPLLVWELSGHRRTSREVRRMLR